MRLAIIADIHSNLEALESVLARIRQEEVEAILNLGDLVGYNASPKECLEMLQSGNGVEPGGEPRPGPAGPGAGPAFQYHCLSGPDVVPGTVARPDIPEIFAGPAPDPGGGGVLSGLPRHPHQRRHLHRLPLPGQTGLSSI